MMIGFAAGLLIMVAFILGYVMADMGNELAHEEGWEEGVTDVIRLLPAEFLEMLAEAEKEALDE